MLKTLVKRFQLEGLTIEILKKKGPDCMSSYADVVKWKDLLSSKITIKAKKDTFWEGNNWL